MNEIITVIRYSMSQLGGSQWLYPEVTDFVLTWEFLLLTSEQFWSWLHESTGAKGDILIQSNPARDNLTETKTIHQLIFLSTWTFCTGDWLLDLRTFHHSNKLETLTFSPQKNSGSEAVLLWGDFNINLDLQLSEFTLDIDTHQDSGRISSHCLNRKSWI